jgi:hypothetical protein
MRLVGAQAAAAEYFPKTMYHNSVLSICAAGADFDAPGAKTGRFGAASVLTGSGRRGARIRLCASLRADR